MRLFARPQLRLAAIIAASVAFGSLSTGTAFAIQGHMFNALHALQNARNQLSMADADKGGYRVQAIGYVDQAISAVNAGIGVGAQ